MSGEANRKQPAVLTYWDGRGNAELIRLMLVVSGESWTERVYGSDASHLSRPGELSSMLADGVLAFDQVPLLQIDGLNLVQKMAVVRYLARKHGLYGGDEVEAVRIDVISEGITDWRLARRRDAAAADAKYLPRLQRALISTSGSYFAESGLSFADVQFFELASTIVEHPDGHSFDLFGSLRDLVDRVAASPAVARYLASERRYPSPGRPGYYERVYAVIPWVREGGGPAPAMGNARWKLENEADDPGRSPR
jgi:glutathione S-transferase